MRVATSPATVHRQTKQFSGGNGETQRERNGIILEKIKKRKSADNLESYI